MNEVWVPNTPYLTVDCVLFDKNSVVLIRRGHEPFKDWYALPGGFVDRGESTEQACAREVKEEIGLDINLENLHLVGVFSDPERDPTRCTVSVAYLAEFNGEPLIAGDDASSVEIIKNWRSEKIAFDHKKIIQDAWKIKKDKN